jgi:hypothetical protein
VGQDEFVVGLVDRQCFQLGEEELFRLLMVGLDDFVEDLVEEQGLERGRFQWVELLKEELVVEGRRVKDQVLN